MPLLLLQGLHPIQISPPLQLVVSAMVFAMTPYLLAKSTFKCFVMDRINLLARNPAPRYSCRTTRRAPLLVVLLLGPAGASLW